MNLGYDYGKLRNNLRGYYIGKGFHNALRAMDFGLEVHSGTRQDGTPEFSHQVFQAQNFRTLDSMALYSEATHCTILLHDSVEDYYDKLGLTFDDIYNLFKKDPAFAQLVSESCELMTNHVNGVKKEESAYYRGIADFSIMFRLSPEEMAPHACASIGKGMDVAHNNLSMVGPFTIERQQKRLKTTKEHVLPMLKSARKLFPEQESIYQNIKHTILTQDELIRALHASIGAKAV